MTQGGRKLPSSKKPSTTLRKNAPVKSVIKRNCVNVHLRKGKKVVGIDKIEATMVGVAQQGHEHLKIVNNLRSASGKMSRAENKK
eukprot:GDKH01009823.1.p1 GENE.GDKH01009823.1~~GDKH01009823.1.p1  ORF type:complete len:85 (-),score=11.56 GDKH01009823.1:137-391(-)